MPGASGFVGPSHRNNGELPAKKNSKEKLLIGSPGDTLHGQRRWSEKACLGPRSPPPHPVKQLVRRGLRAHRLPWLHRCLAGKDPISSLTPNKAECLRGSQSIDPKHVLSSSGSPLSHQPVSKTRRPQNAVLRAAERQVRMLLGNLSQGRHHRGHARVFAEVAEVLTQTPLQQQGHGKQSMSGPKKKKHVAKLPCCWLNLLKA